MSTVSVIGLGKLGAGFAVAAASRGFHVIGVDVSEQVVGAFNAGRAPLEETDLEKYILENRERLNVTKDHTLAIERSDITFIIVATPSDPHGNFSNTYVESALVSLSQSLRNNQKPYHLFVIGSTVMPTSTEERLIPLIENQSGRKLNEGFGICYVPDFVALGSVIRDFLNPDLVVIGQSDARAGQQVEEFYRKFCRNNPSIHRMSIVNAEISKVSLNAYITMKISFANLIGQLCERVPGGNADEVCGAIGHDKRIAPYYLRAGMSYGGTCFPRDTKALAAFGRKVGHDIGLMREVDAINNMQKRQLAELVLREMQSQEKHAVSILGMAFKPGTPEITESASVALLEYLIERDVEVTIFDRLAAKSVEKKFPQRVRVANSLAEAVQSSPVCVVALPEKEFRELPKLLNGNPRVIVDCWRWLDRTMLPDSVRYLALGWGRP